MWDHKVNIPKDIDKGQVVFKWHFPRGTLDKRMSALELSSFLIPHMPNILNLMTSNAIIYTHFCEILLKLTTEPKNALDEVVSWIKSVTRTEENDIVELSITNKGDVPAGPIYFV